MVDTIDVEPALDRELRGVQNRLLVPAVWPFGFVTLGRGARLITREPTASVDNVGNATVGRDGEKSD